MADAIRIERIGSGVTDPMMATMKYPYDALGRRVSRTDTRTGLTEIMVGPVTSRARQEARLSSLQENCEPKTRRRTTGAIAEVIRYTPYGEPTILNASGAVQATSPTGNRSAYTGREYDAEAKGYYFRHRWYSAGLGRFIGRDPLMYPDGVNTSAGWFGVGDLDPDGTDVIRCRSNCAPFVRTGPPGPVLVNTDCPGLGTKRCRNACAKVHPNCDFNVGPDDWWFPKPGPDKCPIKSPLAPNHFVLRTAR